MSDIFIHIYLDEDIDVLVANLLHSRGFNATTAQQAGQLGRTDAEQLKFEIGESSKLIQTIKKNG